MPSKRSFVEPRRQLCPHGALSPLSPIQNTCNMPRHSPSPSPCQGILSLVPKAVPWMLSSVAKAQENLQRVLNRKAEEQQWRWQHLLSPQSALYCSPRNHCCSTITIQIARLILLNHMRACCGTPRPRFKSRTRGASLW